MENSRRLNRCSELEQQRSRRAGLRLEWYEKDAVQDPLSPLQPRRHETTIPECQTQADNRKALDFRAQMTRRKTTAGARYRLLFPEGMGTFCPGFVPLQTLPLF